jgi:hypothetical protein
MTSALEGGGWSTPLPGRFTPGKDPVPIAQEAGWAPGLFWMCATNLAPLTGIRSLDPPARSQSLYPLSYPSPTVRLFGVKKDGVKISCTWSPHHEGIQVAHRYTYTHSGLLHQMEISGQLYALAVLAPEKEPQVGILYTRGWVCPQTWIWCWTGLNKVPKRNISVPPGI